MALSGLEIYKHLPKTNCRDCGFPTCLAFAMALAKKQAELAKCPHVSEEAKGLLQSASQPPIRLITLGTGDQEVSVGNETVMFRHEEKFHHQTAIGFLIEDSLSEAEIKEKVEKINAMSFERVGQILTVNLIAIKQTKDDAHFVETVKKIAGLTKLSFVLMSENESAVKQALAACVDRKPMICSGSDTAEAMVQIAKENKIALGVVADNINSLSDLTGKLTAAGAQDLALNTKEESLTKKIYELTQLRRLALKKNFRALGFPSLVIVDEPDPYQETMKAATLICKYAGIVILKGIEQWQILSLLTLRQNIFTDPQKPLQVEPKVYQIGQTTEKSPLLVTTNFSLTYYTVLSEVESSKVPTHILCVDTEGMSVLTAWAAEKFTADRIASVVEKDKINDIVSHKSIIIPGYVASMSGDLEEKSGLKVLVGPREAAGLTSFLKGLSS
ncbi:acetyl-CoA decarbonylase/synthase complex subunit gamma [Candidatus Omnitrophota bacterium]